MASLDCNAEEIWERIEAGESILVLDLREDHEPSPWAPKSTRRTKLEELSGDSASLERFDEVVCIGEADAQSRQAAELLRAQGILNATFLEGGWPAWEAVAQTRA